MPRKLIVTDTDGTTTQAFIEIGPQSWNSIRTALGVHDGQPPYNAAQVLQWVRRAFANQVHRAAIASATDALSPSEDFEQ